MASLLGGLGDRFPQHNRYLPSKSPAACGGDVYFLITVTRREYCKIAHPYVAQKTGQSSRVYRFIP
jgi:hypothetical protein